MSAELRSSDPDQLFYQTTEAFQVVEAGAAGQEEGKVDRTVAEIVAMNALAVRGNRSGTNNGATEIITSGEDRNIDTGQTD